MTVYLIELPPVLLKLKFSFMKIIPLTNHSSRKSDLDQYFQKVSRHFLFKVSKKCSLVYFGIHNTT